MYQISVYGDISLDFALILTNLHISLEDVEWRVV